MEKKSFEPNFGLGNVSLVVTERLETCVLLLAANVLTRQQRKLPFVSISSMPTFHVKKLYWCCCCVQGKEYCLNFLMFVEILFSRKEHLLNVNNRLQKN